MISGAEIMVKCLEQEGVTMTFGYPGAVICPFYDHIFQSDIEHVLVRSEQNAAHAASGFARTSGKAGVCIATPTSNQPNYWNRYCLHGFHSLSGHHWAGKLRPAGPGCVPGGRHYRRLRTIY